MAYRFFIIFIIGAVLFNNTSAICIETIKDQGGKSGIGGLAVPSIILPEGYSGYIERVFPSQEGEYFVKLKSGLTVLIKELDYSPVVSCRATVKAGSIFENEYLGCGISHYLEHIVAGGTTQLRTEQQNAEILKKLGGASNAATSYDNTSYYINTTSDQWKTAVAQILSYMTQCEFKETEVIREKEVILQELRMYENDPDRQLWQLFVSSAYQSDPVKYPIIGFSELFKNITRNDLLKYYARMYQPQNIVISVVGGIDGVDALKEVITLAKGFQKKSMVSYETPQEKPQVSSRWFEQSHPAARSTSVKIGFPSVSLMDSDVYPLDVLALILGAGRPSRLYKSLKDEKQIVLSFDCANWTPFHGNGVFILSLDLDYDKINPAISVIWDEIKKIEGSGVTIEELNRAKQKVVAEKIFNNQEASDISFEISYNYLISGDPHYYDKYIEGIKNVTSDDIKRVVKKYLLPEKQITVILKPQSQIKPSALKDGVKTKSQDVKKIVLPNGMRVLIKVNPDYPVVDYKLFLKGGLRYENDNETGVSRFCANMLDRGTKTRTLEDIAKLVEDIGGKFNCGSASNTVSVECSVMAQYADKGFDILSDVALNPVFPQTEIEKLRKDTLLVIEKQDESWETEVMRFFSKKYYKKHPYRNDTLGTKESITALNQKVIEGFYNKVFVPENMVLAVYGNFNQDEILKKIESSFGKLPAKKSFEPKIDVETGTRLSGDTVIEKTSDKSSVSIFWGFPGMTIYDKDKPAMDVLDAVMSGIGYPSGWLQEGLRGNNKSLVYVVHAFSQFGIDGGFFAILSQTTPENYDPVIQIIRKNIDKAGNGEISDEELVLAKNICVAMLKMGLETLAAQAYTAAVNETLGLGYDYDKKYVEAISKVTKADVARVAKKYLKNSLLASVFPEGYKNTKVKR